MAKPESNEDHYSVIWHVEDVALSGMLIDIIIIHSKYFPISDWLQSFP